MSLTLYIPEKDDLRTLLNRAEANAAENGCFLDPLTFPDANYFIFLASMIQKEASMQLLGLVDAFYEILEESSGSTVPVDWFVESIGNLLAQAGRWPKAEMHFWIIYILPYLCGASEFVEVFQNELAAFASQVEGKNYERKPYPPCVYLLEFPSIEDVVERTRQAVIACQDDESLPMTLEQSTELDSILGQYANKADTADEWFRVIHRDLSEYEPYSQIFLITWLTKYGLPYIFGIPQTVQKAKEVVSRLPILTSQ